jgi:hypothetical protein
MSGIEISPAFAGTCGGGHDAEAASVAPSSSLACAGLETRTTADLEIGATSSTDAGLETRTTGDLHPNNEGLSLGTPHLEIGSTTSL